MAEDQIHLKFEAICRALRALWDAPSVMVPGYSRTMRPCAAPLGIKGLGPSRRGPDQARRP
jgi:hypothetical protein